MRTACPPDLSSRPLKMTCELFINAKTAAVYEAWTRKFDSWFAQRGTLFMTPKVDSPYFFYTPDEWGRHPHYGRFTELLENQVVEMTWMTGNGTHEGTEGAETVLRIELRPRGEGTELRLTHSGFVSEKARDGHQTAWPQALELLDKALTR